jgi:hypothetical protein
VIHPERAGGREGVRAMVVETERRSAITNAEGLAGTVRQGGRFDGLGVWGSGKAYTGAFVKPTDNPVQRSH